MVGLGVVVTSEARTKSSRAVFSTWLKLFRQPLLVEATIVGKLGQGYLKEAVALSAGALLSSMAVLIHNTISKGVGLFTVIILHEITIGVGLLQRGGLQLDVGLQVGVLEGEREGADVGGPG